MNCFNFNMVLGILTLLLGITISQGLTNPNDVAAINSLYVALGSPSLPGWVARGGDPCAGQWQGVVCENSTISSITLIGANLGGELGNSLGGFSSIKIITLSNNRIGGRIPSNLPATLKNLFLSDNRLTGSIPTSLSTLTQLSAMSLNANGLTGEIPDAFGRLQALVNLDLSSNDLRGPLPPSMKSLSSLTTLRLQDNRLSGTLDVLQDLPLKDLDVHNNSFSGPIPSKLLSIPKFRSDGNPFNNSVIPSPPPKSSEAKPAPAPAPSPAQTRAPAPSPRFVPGPSPAQKPLPPGQQPTKKVYGPTATKESSYSRLKKSSSKKRAAWISIGVLLSFLMLLLGVILCMKKCSRQRREEHRAQHRNEIIPYPGVEENPRDGGAVVILNHDDEKAYPLAVVRVNEKGQQTEEHIVIIPDADFPLRPPPPLALPEKFTFNQVIAVGPALNRAFIGNVPKTSIRAYSLASLQEYTNSFSEDNLIGCGILGKVYRAELPNGTLLAIKRLSNKVAKHVKEGQFIMLVNSIDKIRHMNVVALTGYCLEHEERFLVYEYCSNGTLQDALHFDDEYMHKLSWNARIKIALGAARALEYLHEICEPHGNFNSSNFLLNDKLDNVLVSDCGLAPLLLLPGIVCEPSANHSMSYGYSAPELESGIYTPMSDVYSFGVVMLELLTGRMPYDGTRPRGEQVLVRWAVPQLHDIDALSRMVDPALDGNCRVRLLSHFADIISRCLMAEPEFRPPMSQLVHDLTNLLCRECQSPLRIKGSH